MTVSAASEAMVVVDVVVVVVANVVAVDVFPVLLLPNMSEVALSASAHPIIPIMAAREKLC